MRKLALLLAGLVTGCGPDTPAQPTWSEDVRPILLANCARCHGEEPAGGAPAAFRLDRYEDGGRRGARTMAPYLAERAGKRGDMPPEGPRLTDRQRDILVRWAEQMAPRGAPGQMSTARLVAPPAGADQGLELTVDARDPDGDAVEGSLAFGPDGASVPQTAIGPIGSGRNVVRWDTSGLPPGTYKLFAQLSEGESSVTIDLGGVTVAHASGNSAPAAQLELAGLQPIAADAASPQTLFLTARDAEGHAMTARLVAFRGDEEREITSGLALTSGTPAMVFWDTRSVPEGPNWRVRAEVSDGVATTTATTGQVVISHATTADTFGAIEPIFQARCAPCHPLPVAVDLGGEGIGVWTGTIWRRVVQRREMPPRSATGVVMGFTPLTEEERMRISAWLLAGAPP